MKVLTVKQPWARLIAAGWKDVENRSWATAYWGPIAIHAGVSVDEGYGVAYPDEFAHPPVPAAQLRGVIVAVVDLVDVVTDSRSSWAHTDAFHWCLATPRQILEPIPFKGTLGLTSLPANIVEQIESQLQPERNTR